MRVNQLVPSLPWAHTSAVMCPWQVASDFKLYSGGVYTSTTCQSGPDNVNHAVRRLLPITCRGVNTGLGNLSSLVSDMGILLRDSAQGS